MNEISRHTLENGLRVLILQDPTTPMCVVNTLYGVGARDESPSRTGFAHLFEHLMFGGSKNIPDFDKVLQEAGGTNNAFTSNDLTNYYNVLPAENLETALWLESDRMLELEFSPKSLEVQRQVVIEEFKQRYLNQPYGNVWLELRPLAYRQHSYQWATIGKNIEHIEEATLDDVKEFFYNFYSPSNAVLCVAGNVEVDATLAAVEKWFGEIPSREVFRRPIPSEPVQEEPRFKEVHSDVPQEAFYIAYHMGERFSENYYAMAQVSNLMTGGESSRLFDRYVKQQQSLTEFGSFPMGHLDPGLWVVYGKVSESHDAAEEAQKVITDLGKSLEEKITEKERLKVERKFRTALAYEERELTSRAYQACFFEMFDKVENMNSEEQRYSDISSEQMTRCAREVLTQDNSSTLIIRKK